ncbi:DUF4169 family protein [Falsiroseomonas sp. CW058]|uniref:DUF4169 family protein n=1 Tax=Falsiroseomonas sp. CW058 TaxID=3388664 RepID=UPI003D32218D
MGDPVNLNKARKARDRAMREAEAAANRAKHGRSKAEKANDRREEERRRALLDGARKEETPG